MLLSATLRCQAGKFWWRPRCNRGWHSAHRFEKCERRFSDQWIKAFGLQL